MKIFYMRGVGLSKSIDRKIRHMTEILTSAFLFSLQYIPIFDYMIYPVTIYVLVLMSAYLGFLETQINLLFFSERLMFGRIVAIIGFIIFLVACVQFLRRDKKVITTGLYSLVRHPQYFGIAVMTLGTTTMCMPFTYGRPKVIYAWLIQVLGYILLAAYEEQYLLREHGREYQQYRQKAPFIFPIPRLTKIPEPIVSIVLTLIIANVFWFFTQIYYFYDLLVAINRLGLLIFNTCGFLIFLVSILVAIAVKKRRK